jgi:hypothetical protein
LAHYAVQEIDAEGLRMLLGELPAWIKFPDFERVLWLNRMIEELWPYVDVGVSDIIRQVT